MKTTVLQHVANGVHYAGHHGYLLASLLLDLPPPPWEAGEGREGAHPGPPRPTRAHPGTSADPGTSEKAPMDALKYNFSTNNWPFSGPPINKKRLFNFVSHPTPPSSPSPPSFPTLPFSPSPPSPPSPLISITSIIIKKIGLHNI